MHFEQVERALHERLNALGPAPRAELPHVLMLPDYERADRIGEFWSYPQSRALAELLIDCEADRTLRAVVVGMLWEGRPGFLPVACRGQGGIAFRQVAYAEQWQTSHVWIGQLWEESTQWTSLPRQEDQMPARKRVTNKVVGAGKKVLATDAAQGVIGAVADKMEEIAVDKADDAAKIVKEKAAKAGGRRPSSKRSATTLKTGARKTGTRKTAARKTGARKAGVRKAGVRKTTARKTGARKTTARKTGARKTAARKTGARKAGVRKAGVRKTTARKTGARKTTARKTGARKTTARKTGARKAGARKAGVRKTTARKTRARKTTARKAGARKTTARKTGARKTSARTGSRKSNARKRS